MARLRLALKSYRGHDLPFMCVIQPWLQGESSECKGFDGIILTKAHGLDENGLDVDRESVASSNTISKLPMKACTGKGLPSRELVHSLHDEVGWPMLAGARAFDTPFTTG